MKKVIVILSLVFICGLGFSLYWGIGNYTDLKKVKSEYTGAYDEGYNNALSNKEEYVRLINSYKNTIVRLNSQISTLQQLVNQLQTTNDLNVKTIISLNNQINELNSQIDSLKNKIAELQKTIDYYESYIASIETADQAVVTFEFNGSVYNIQIVNKGSTVTVNNPQSTDYIIFNYWTVDGQQIDLSTYQFTTNTKVVANVTYKYDVKFMVDDSVYNSQIVVKNGYATIPINPTKTGCMFLGWSLNGQDIVENIDSIEVINNTTYIAIFSFSQNGIFEGDGYSLVIEDNSISSFSASTINENHKVSEGRYNHSVDSGDGSVYFTLEYIEESDCWLYVEDGNSHYLSRV